MKMFEGWKKIVSICFLIVTTVVSLFIFNSSQNTHFVQEKDQAKEFSKPSTVAEASQSAGYRVSTLAILPKGFKEKQDISVSAISQNENSPIRVTQIWSSGTKGQFLLLDQDPTLSGIGNGESTEINGFNGQKYLKEANGEVPPMLTLYWRDGDMGYALTGTLTELIDEETMYKIAKSVR